MKSHQISQNNKINDIKLCLMMYKMKHAVGPSGIDSEGVWNGIYSNQQTIQSNSLIFGCYYHSLGHN